MIARVCKNCGQVHQETDKRLNCIKCGQMLSQQYCSRCKQCLDIKHFQNVKGCRYCRDCKRIVNREWYRADPNRERNYKKKYRKQHTETITKEFNEWLEKTKNLPAPLLTEDEWLKTCDHFNGCALCGSPNVEIRMFFIHFKDGGKYTKWNVYPTCIKCADVPAVSTDNPFGWTKSFLNTGVLKVTPERRSNLIEYLKSQMEGLKNED